MKITIAKEADAGEPRAAAAPETIKFKALGADIAVARRAGGGSGIPDAEFEAAGASIVEDPGKDADLVLKAGAM